MDEEKKKLEDCPRGQTEFPYGAGKSMKLFENTWKPCIVNYNVEEVLFYCTLEQHKIGGANYDEAILAQQREIEREVNANQLLISERLNVSALLEEYKDDPVFIAKIQNLEEKFTSLRRIRGDGNCFFRAFGFTYFERLLSSPAECKKFRARLERCKDELVTRGYPLFTLEDFHDNFVDVLMRVEQQTLPMNDLFELFNDQGQSDYLVVYIRLIVSAHLQKESVFFENFIEGGKTVKEFCNQEVEPMGKESDHIHITALTSALDVSVSVVYVDRAGDELSIIDFTPQTEPDSATHKLSLLYRPGHYDILYA